MRGAFVNYAAVHVATLLTERRALPALALRVFFDDEDDARTDTPAAQNCKSGNGSATDVYDARIFIRKGPFRAHALLYSDSCTYRVNRFAVEIPLA